MAIPELIPSVGRDILGKTERSRSHLKLVEPQINPEEKQIFEAPPQTQIRKSNKLEAINEFSKYYVPQGSYAQRIYREQEKKKERIARIQRRQLEKKLTLGRTFILDE